MEAAVGSEGVAWDHLAVAETVQQIAGPTVNARLERDGTRYVLEVSDPDKAAKLKQVTVLSNGVKVRVCSHPVFNQVRCVISRKEIINVPERTLREQLAAQGVVAVKRICKGSGSEKVGTSSIILTFDGTSFPETVKYGLLIFATRPYYPKPLQCYNCYGFGHSRKGCKTKTRCRVCSGTHATEGKCRAKAFCSNCRGNHQPDYRKCPTYKREAGVLKLQTDLGVTFREAKQIWNSENTEGGKSYAAIVKTTPTVPSRSQASDPRKPQQKKAAKSPPNKSVGGDGAKSSKGPTVGKKRKAPKTTKKVGGGVNPPVNEGRKNAGREGKVRKHANKCVGTDPLPDAASPAKCEEKQLLQQQVESFSVEIAQLKEKYAEALKTIDRLEKVCKRLSGQLEKASEPTLEVESGPPLTRRKRKLTGLDTVPSGKSRKKEGSGTDPPLALVPDCESDAATGQSEPHG